MIIQVRRLILADGSSPFLAWYRGLGPEKRAFIDRRLLQVRQGNLGDHRRLKAGLVELRLHQGAGLRVYGGLWKGSFFLLAWGGDKQGQARDIARASELWLRFTKQTDDEVGHGLQD